jgi:4-amino-4-deoxychorismate lyase
MMAADHAEHGLLVTADGRVAPRDEPLLLADDLGVLRGDGLFETLLVVDGEPQALDEHIARMRRSADAMELEPPSTEEWQRSVALAVSAWTGEPEMAIRMIVTRGSRRGPTWYLLADPVDPMVRARRREGVSAVTVERGLGPDLASRAPWLLMGSKLLSYAVNMAAVRWAQTQGADDAIYVADGLVLEATTSAVVVAMGSRLLTPPSSLGILPSITVIRLFAAAGSGDWETGYEPLHIDDLFDADGVWLLNSVSQAVRIHTLNSTPLERADNELHARVASLLS